jgi:riboflavin synthase
MFNGIIEETATVLNSIEGAKFRRLILNISWDDLRLGDSVAVNGVCLTVAEKSGTETHYDVIEETLQKTNLGQLQVGDSVHVERSLRVGDRIDGHFVQGHVDGVGLLIDQINNPVEWRLRIEVSVDLAKYLIPKGSICIDGVSLTLAAVRDNVFEVALIPMTLQRTLLGKRSPGYRFNIEGDILSKTTITWLERQRQ